MIATCHSWMDYTDSPLEEEREGGETAVNHRCYFHA